MLIIYYFRYQINCYSKAIEVDPSSYVLFSNRAAAYMKLKRYEEALKDADICIQLSPDFLKVSKNKIWWKLLNTAAYASAAILLQNACSIIGVSCILLSFINLIMIETTIFFAFCYYCWLWYSLCFINFIEYKIYGFIHFQLLLSMWLLLFFIGS